MTRSARFANILRTRNVKKGDRVTIYLPMIPEAAYAMLACARIGAIHSVVFAGFSPDSLAQRITDCQSKVVITADEGLRGGKKVPLKANVDAAIAKSGGVDWVVVVKRTGAAVDMNPTRDLWYHDAAEMVTTECPCRARCTRKIRCSSSTRRARPASPRACCTPPAAIWCSRR